jgi:hypothetical protein
MDVFRGREASPVGRPDFKSGKGREAVFGGFDSHSLPPASGMARQRQLPGYRGFIELRGHFRRLFQVTIVYERVEVDGMLDEFVTL